MSTCKPLDRYAVIGNPIAHSRSPAIHARFAELTGEPVQYGRLLAPIDGFAQTVSAMRAAGMRGANVTVPFKFEAHALCDSLSVRAQQAGAVNTLSFTDTGIVGDNTDGAGLLSDLLRLCARSPGSSDTDGASALRGARLLVLGAGGAVAGVLRPLLDAQPASLVLLNRTASKASDLISALRSDYPRIRLHADHFDCARESVDIIINGTSTGLSDAAPPLPLQWFKGAMLAYDMMYGAQPTAFMRLATAESVAAADGLGMLVGQAAEAFFQWRGIRPPLEPVLDALRSEMSRPSAVGAGSQQRT